MIANLEIKLQPKHRLRDPNHLDTAVRLSTLSYDNSGAIKIQKYVTDGRSKDLYFLKYTRLPLYSSGLSNHSKNVYFTSTNS